MSEAIRGVGGRVDALGTRVDVLTTRVDAGFSAVNDELRAIDGIVTVLEKREATSNQRQQKISCR